MNPIALGVDYASPHNEAQVKCLKDRGVSFVVRYLAPSHLSWKRLTSTEAEMISRMGMNIVSVYQARMNQIADFTQARAITDAHAAIQSAREAGQPERSAIYFAVDFNVQPSEYGIIQDYLRTVHRELDGRYRLGIYGHDAVCQAMYQRGAVDYIWQTYAWSGDRLVSGAHLFQFQNGVNWCHGSNDLNYCFQDPGWWRIGGVLSPPSGIQYRLVRQGDRGWDVRRMQGLLQSHSISPGVVDGIFGTRTLAAVHQFQRIKGLVVDGLVGKKTWAALLGTEDEPAQDWKALYEREKERADALERKIAKAQSVLGGD